MRKTAHIKYTVVLAFLCFGAAYMIHQLFLNQSNCAVRLKSLCSMLLLYQHENKELPDFEIWYDLLIQEFELPIEIFQCANRKQEGKLGHFIINKYHSPKWDGPGDQVLIFEGGAGWNQYGDKDQMVPRHSGGCYILFSNGNVKLVKQEDFSKLLWTASNE